MVFGWTKKKEPKIPTEPAFSQITLNDVPEIIDRLAAQRSNTVVNDAKELRNVIVPKLQELVNIANTLQRDDLNMDDVDKNLKTLVIRGKKQVISIIQNEATKKLSKIDSFDDVVSFGTDLNQILKKIGVVLGRQTRVIHIFAKKYAQKLKDVLSDLTADNESLSNIIKNHNRFRTLYNEIRSNINEIDDSKKQIEQKRLRIEDLMNQIQSLESKIQDDENTVNKLESSDEYQSFLETQHKLDDLQKEKTKLRQQINDHFTKISRPLSKYVYVSALDKEQKMLLSKLIENPFDAMKPEYKRDVIDILEAVKKGVLSGSVSVKDKEKTISYIDETVRSLDDLQKRVFDFLTKENDLNNLLKKLDVSELRAAKDRLAKNRQSKDEYGSRIESLRTEIKELEDQKPHLVSKIELLLHDISSSNYKIKE